jgi:hypothetical protein
MDVNAHIFLDVDDIITVDPDGTTHGWRFWVGFKSRPFSLLSGVHMNEAQARDLHTKLGNALDGLDHDRAKEA